MKTFLPILCAFALLTHASADDQLSPKPTATYLFRVLLHVPGVQRTLDYTDVVKIHSCTHESITFETSDGFIVAHQGAYTLIGPKTELQNRKGVLEGGRFFDPK